MIARSRFTLALMGTLLGALVVVGTLVPAAEAKAKAVPKVYGLAAAGSNLTTTKLGLKWRKVTGATYQVRWATSTKTLPKAKLYATKATSALSPALGNVCATYYAQVRAKKGTKFGPWSVARSLKFAGTSGIPAAVPVTTGQTSTSAAQVRWTKRPGAAGYRLHWSPAPYGNWPGYFPYTATTAATTTGLSIPLPAVGAGDRFMGAAYGNPIFGQLETKKCSGVYTKAPFVPIWPKAPAPGDATTGSPVSFGTYNLELVPNSTTQPTKIINIADNIAAQDLDVIALQEANTQTATDLITQLATEGQTDWQAYGVGQQQVMWRTGDWTSVSTHDVGMPNDGTATTPLPTPGVRLTPAVADPTRQDIFVVSAHLEDRKKFDPFATIPQQKSEAHDAVVAMMAKIDAANGGVPTMVAGDLKGNFGGGSQPAGAGYCDESSSPACIGEGQPTFIRAGYIDAQAAVTKVGVQYGTVNKHVVNQPASNSGVGGRADFLVFKGVTGVAKYENVWKTYGDASATQQPDHNLLYAQVFIPFVP